MVTINSVNSSLLGRKLEFIGGKEKCLEIL